MEERRRESKEDLLSFVEGKAIPLTLGDGTPLPKGEVLGHIYSRILYKGESYVGELVPRVGIRFYTEAGKKIEILSVSSDDRTKQLEEALRNQVEVKAY